jgi:hypothetical protein
MAEFPRVSFGMIVLNGEPFTRYNLRSIYPFAHEIIVVEGAVESAAAIATQDGHSIDGTLEALHRFKTEEDPENKLTIITKEGFWHEKDAMSQAYAERATGDYLWQVDSDEFYHAGDMRKVLKLLRDDPAITSLSFRQISFWGGFNYYTDGRFLSKIFPDIHRVFKWGADYRYITHRPPTVHDPQGRNLRKLKWLDGAFWDRHEVRMYHYSLIFPLQVTRKAHYYKQATWTGAGDAENWARDVYFGLKYPYRVHNVYQHPSWLMRFKGQHPEQIEALRADLEAGRVKVEQRHMDDIERLLESPRYKIGRWLLQTNEHFYPIWQFLRRARASLSYRSGLLLDRLRGETR